MYLNENYNPYSESSESETPVQNGAKVKKQKTHKKGHFKKFIAWICTAVLLGGFAGAAFYGVYYAGSKVIPVKQNKTSISSTANTGNNSSGTQVSSTDTKKEIKATVMDVSELVDSVITSVVAISGEVTSYNYGFFGGEQQKSAVSGSGIIIGVNDDEVIIVTNAHVIDGVDEGTIKVKLYDGTELNAYVKGSKTAYDLAVIAVKKSDVPSDAVYSVATLGDSTKIKVGESAIVVGNAMGTGISVTTGIVSALNKTITVSNTEYKDLIQTDAAINPGNSGGALFNAEGEVMGISSVKLSTTSVEGMGYAISVSSVKEVIEELSLMAARKKYSEDERGYLGITGVTISSQISKEYGYPEGVLVRSVADNSGADNAGIVKNDIIKSVDGESVETFDSLREMMSYYKVGEDVEVVYCRLNDKGEYDEKTVTVTLTAKS